MKKLISLLLFAMASLTSSVQAGSHIHVSFLGNNQNLWVSNAANASLSYQFGYTNFWYVSPGLTNYQQSLSPAFTNTIQMFSNNIAITVTNIIYNAPGSIDLKPWTDANMDVAPLSFYARLNDTNVYYHSGQNQPISSTNFPAIPTSLALTTTSTNFITNTFFKSIDGTFYDTSNTFVWVIQAPGTTAKSFSTNAPATFLQGAAKIRWQVDTSTNTTSGVVISDVGFGGWAP